MSTEVFCFSSFLQIFLLVTKIALNSDGLRVSCHKTNYPNIKFKHIYFSSDMTPWFVKLGTPYSFVLVLISLRYVVVMKAFFGKWVYKCLVTQNMDYSIFSGLITLKGFFQVRNHKEYQNVIMISFVHLEKINIFCFMHQGMAQKLSLPRRLEN